MGLFDFFKRKKQEEVVVDNSQPQVILTKREYSKDICEICKGEIGIERYKRVGGEIMHKRCFKKIAGGIMNGRGI